MLAFRIFMLCMVLLIPLTMIGLGRHFLRKPPQEINALFGYRTAMSMINRETWDFAHRVCGRLWLRLGLLLLPVSLIPLLIVFGRDIDTIGKVGCYTVFLQIIPLVGSIFPVERALKKEFDQYGRRRQR